MYTHPIINAVNRDNNDLAIRLVNEGQHINSYYDNKHLIDELFMFTRYGREDKKEIYLHLLKLTIQKIVDFNFVKDTASIFKFFLKKQDLEILEILKTKVDVNNLNINNQSLLSLALIEQDIFSINFLAKNGANVNDNNIGYSACYTPLTLAIKNNNIDIVNVLLSNNADVNLPDKEGRSPLSEAISNQNKDIVNILLNHNADVNLPNIDGLRPLSLAARNNNIELAKLLISHNADLNFVENGEATPKIIALYHGKSTPISIALYHGNYEIIELLIDSGANLNINIEGYNKFFLEVLFYHFKRLDYNDDDKQNYNHLIKKVITAGADLNLLSDNGLEIFKFYYQNKDIEILNFFRENLNLYLSRRGVIDDLARNLDVSTIEFLINQGVNTNQLYPTHGTLTIENEEPVAVCKNLLQSYITNNYHNLNNQIIDRLLLNNGDIINSKDSVSRGILNHDEHFMFPNFNSLKLLLEKGIDINMRGFHNLTPLMRIVTFENEVSEILKLFINNGADVNAKDQRGITPLFYAADSGNINIMKYLIYKGAEVNFVNNLNENPLLYMIDDEDLPSETVFQVASLLIENGLNIHAQDDEGNSALMKASILGNYEVVKLLIEKGAELNILNNNNESILDVTPDAFNNIKQLIKFAQKAEIIANFNSQANNDINTIASEAYVDLENSAQLDIINDAANIIITRFANKIISLNQNPEEFSMENLNGQFLNIQNYILELKQKQVGQDTEEYQEFSNNYTNLITQTKNDIENIVNKSVFHKLFDLLSKDVIQSKDQVKVALLSKIDVSKGITPRSFDDVFNREKGDCLINDIIVNRFLKSDYNWIQNTIKYFPNKIFENYHKLSLSNREKINSLVDDVLELQSKDYFPKDLIVQGLKYFKSLIDSFSPELNQENEDLTNPFSALIIDDISDQANIDNPELTVMGSN